METWSSGGCWGGPKRAAIAAERAKEEVEASCCAELVPSAVEVLVGAGLVAADETPRCLLAPPARESSSASRAGAESFSAESAAAIASATAALRRNTSSSAADAAF